MQVEPFPLIERLLCEQPLYSVFSLAETVDPRVAAEYARLAQEHAARAQAPISDDPLTPGPSPDQIIAERSGLSLTVLRRYSGPLDVYCLGCADRSVFRDFSSRGGGAGLPVETAVEPFQYKHFACARNQGHRLYFAFFVDRDAWTITKVGQLPSLADLSSGDTEKYRAALGDPSLYAELRRAIGLVSHGIGVGSFVYLRRVFEALLERAHLKAKNEAGWDEGAYLAHRTDEKIQTLRAFLPSFLVENRAMHGILSKGVHELGEDECLAYFPVVRAGIELILDEVLAEKEKLAKVGQARKAIADLAGKLKSGEPGKG